MQPAPSTPGFFMVAAFAGFLAVATVLVVHLLSRRASTAERDRLFAMGYYLPRRGSRWPQALFCTALGVGVPIAALTFAYAGESTEFVNLWVIACIISVAAITGSTIVASIVFFRPEPSAEPQKLSPDHAKPATDPDALDFAGRLGRG